MKNLEPTGAAVLVKGSAKERSPLSVSYDREADTLTIDGTQFTGNVFRTMGFPRTDRVYIFERHGDVIDIIEMGIFENKETGEHFVGPAKDSDTRQ